MSHIDPLRFAPFRHNETVANDNACRLPAWLQGAQRLAVCLAGEGQIVRAPEVARSLRLIRPVIRNGFVDLPAVQTYRVRITALPLKSGRKPGLSDAGKYTQKYGK